MRLILSLLIFVLSSGAFAAETEPAPAVKPVTPIAVKQLSPTRYRIPQDGLDHALMTLPDVLAQAKAVPNVEQGQPAGYKLLAIVPGSFISKLGLRNGDVIVKVNGQAMNDAGSALAMVLSSRGKTQFVVDLKRGGKRLTYDYEVVPGGSP